LIGVTDEAFEVRMNSITTLASDGRKRRYNYSLERMIAISENPNLTLPQRAVLSDANRRANRSGTFRIRNKVWAAALGISPRQLQRTLRQLEQLGLIEIRRRRDPANVTRNLSNEYALVLATNDINVMTPHDTNVTTLMTSMSPSEDSSWKTPSLKTPLGGTSRFPEEEAEKTKRGESSAPAASRSADDVPRGWLELHRSKVERDGEKGALAAWYALRRYREWGAGNMSTSQHTSFQQARALLSDVDLLELMPRAKSESELYELALHEAGREHERAVPTGVLIL
jgi:DNA-binding transcriptional ArsR family regulator